jgi:L-alanine-DL-glutamate epimerase-like enolase superfamily enzyme
MMTIKRIAADWLHVPIPEERRHTTDFGRIDAFDSTLVRVETEGGLTGFGEAKAAVGSVGTNVALTSCIEQELAPLLLGEDARDISRLWDVCTTARAPTSRWRAATTSRCSAGAG